MRLYHDINLGVLYNIIQNNKTILDVGCGAGTLGEILKKRGNKVYGIDISEESIKTARERIDYAEVCDLEKNELPFLEKFDIIIFADVLEHVINPGEILQKAKRYLKKDGIVISSIPNVAVWFVRLCLLFGDFTYAESGILDKTHLKFYTLNSVKELFIENGYEIKKIDITPGFARLFVPFIRRMNGNGSDEKLLNSSYYKFYIKYLYKIEYLLSKIRRTLFAYQFIMICRPRRDSDYQE